MPTYEYQCDKCEEISVHFHGLDEPGPGKCEKCETELRRCISRPKFVLKGIGWERDKYARIRPMEYIGSKEQALNNGTWEEKTAYCNKLKTEEERAEIDRKTTPLQVSKA